MLLSGAVHTLSPRVRRLVAPNPSAMTGPGTNTYLVGEKALAVIDPGPADAGHLEAILAAAGEVPIRWVLVTHTHHDHSPGALPLAARCGARLLGPTTLGELYEDESFCPDVPLTHGFALDTGETLIRAIHTPGHVGNHYCYLVESDGILMTGDHIMQGSTVVIIPPGGDMKDYLESLELLKDYDLVAIAPGHGDLIANPYQEVQRLLDHRRGREQKVRLALQRLQRSTLEELLVSAYDDVAPAMHPIAQYSLLAHLIKLEKEGEARRDQNLWYCTHG